MLAGNLVTRARPRAVDARRAAGLAPARWAGVIQLPQGRAARTGCHGYGHGGQEPRWGQAPRRRAARPLLGAGQGEQGCMHMALVPAARAASSPASGLPELTP